ncbi:hypothetical protein N836_00235 [Leptolyngbya sp. Heron Island J]|uniref:hypothetical protein n=1 Tax=Leptolyngbya sp. Heron Island J TaxID=1385935 RepID=UPI0003B9DEF2|nr:hypothetical protein [Leptolyngbya sp. Heron Island J]ESA37141.1 hypothetical protein N836_00235 [Leptolyngbya sp. Heron Island J]
MKHNPSSEPQPVERPIQSIRETVLAAAATVDKTGTGSAAMVRSVAEHIKEQQPQVHTKSSDTPLY